MIRKILAVICSLITLFVLKETFYIFTTAEAEVARQRSIYIVIALSIAIPMVILSLWLWSPASAKKDENQTN